MSTLASTQHGETRPNIMIHRRFENQRRYISIDGVKVGWALKDKYGSWKIHSLKEGQVDLVETFNYVESSIRKHIDRFI